MSNTAWSLFDFGSKPNGEAPAKAASMARVDSSPRKPASETARAAAAQIMAETMNSAHAHSKPAAAGVSVATKAERRHRRRVKISAPVRVRQVDSGHAVEFDLTMTTDVSREGILFETSRPSYQRGQEVAVVFPYRPLPGDSVREQCGQVVRVVRASENRYGVAVAFVDRPPSYELLDSAGNPAKVKPESGAPPAERTALRPRPLVIVVDAEAQQRAALRAELEMQGYAVETVPDPSLAVALLRHRTPVALLCEAETFAGVMPGGGEMSGYDLCVIVRRNPRYGRMPVILTSRTGLPSDFATAHALGATICVAKPYDTQRIGNLFRMVAPIAE